MTELLEFKEKLKSIYARYDTYFDIALKFIVALVAVVLINSNIGYMEKLSNPLVTVIIALICALLPYGLIAVVLAGVILANVYAVSLEMTLIIGLLFFVIAVLYYSFHPSDAYILIVTPILFAFKLPYLVPLLAGLGLGFTSIVPVSCGIILYYILTFVKANAALLTNDSAMDITERYVSLLKGIITGKEMWFIIIVFALTIIIVFLIRNLSFNYSRYIAIGIGVVVMLLGLFVGQGLLAIIVMQSTIGALASLVISALIACLMVTFVFSVDYKRTEYTQFEDDDYYYYVKAVPKFKVSQSDIKVQRFNKTEKKRKETDDLF